MEKQFLDEMSALFEKYNKRSGYVIVINELKGKVLDCSDFVVTNRDGSVDSLIMNLRECIKDLLNEVGSPKQSEN